MKNFKIYTINKVLIVKRTFRGMLVLRINIVLIILILSTFLAFTLNNNIEKIDNKKIQFIVLLSICLIMASVLFYSNFFEKAVSITRIESGFTINNREIVLTENLESIIVEEYVSSEAITGNVTIKVKSIENSIVLFRGVAPKDCNQILKELLEFLKLDYSIVKRVVC